MVHIRHITDIFPHIIGLKAVVFDLDDTLYGEKEYVRSGYAAIAKLLPQVERAEEKLWAAFEQGLSAIDEVLKNEGIWSEELKQRCLHTYRHHAPTIHLYAGGDAMLEELREQGYQLGIITDGRPEGQWAKLRALGLEERVEHIIVTDELGGIEFRKPNAAAFMRMKEWLGVEFSEMCYVGDNTRKDFVAPAQLGMRCIHFCNPEGLYFKANTQEKGDSEP